MSIKDILLKYDMVHIFHSIKCVYGESLFEKFISYIKEMYDLDPSYKPVDIIDVMSEDELVLNIRVYFDSEDERHILKIGIKDKHLNNLISYLEENFSLFEDYNTYSLENYRNPKTTQEHINELHRILVQTCLNYMKEHELIDIDEISFSANGLSLSYEYNEWTPATDSSLIVVGLQEENKEDNYLVRKIIGESF